MRPRKRILCYDPDPTALSSLVFTLDVTGYRALSADTWQDALALFREDSNLEMAIIDIADADGWGEGIVATIKRERPSLPVIAICTREQIVKGVLKAADVLWAKQWLSMAELLQRTKIMCTRKRGPKPQGMSPAVAERVRARAA